MKREFAMPEKRISINMSDGGDPEYNSEFPRTEESRRSEARIHAMIAKQHAEKEEARKKAAAKRNEETVA